jgi:hypothetical protein
MIKSLTAIAILAVSISACTTRIDEHGERYRNDEIRVIRDDGYYRDGYRDDNHNGNFCPPGHAKKGWC